MNQMFEIQIENPKVLKDSMQVISNLISEGVFQIKEDGIELVAADPAMVALVDFKILKEAFNKFEVSEEGEIGVNIENLYSILRRASGSDNLTLKTDGSSKLSLVLENESKRSFTLPLLNMSDEDIPDTGDLEFNVLADMDSSVLENGIGDASVVGDSVTFESEDGDIFIKAESSSSDVEFKISKGSDAILDMEEGEAKSMFSIDYLNKMIKASKLSGTVRVFLGKDYPMRLDFKVPDTLELGFILAPRIEEE